jgi:hypothetical protein
MTFNPEPLPQARYFEVYYGDDLRGSNLETQHIVFREATAAPAEMPSEPTLLKTRIEGTVGIAASVIKDSARLAQYINQIGGLARTGLEGGQLNVATAGLTSFQERFSRDEGVPLRGRYIKKMVLIGLLMGFIALMLALIGPIVIGHKFSSLLTDIPELSLAIPITRSALFIVVGICLGASFSAFVRNRTVTFANIGYFDQDSLSPTLRYIFLLILGTILAILLFKGWLIVGITTDLLLNNFAEESVIAIILGLMVGFAEANVTRMVTGGMEAVKDWRSPTP